MNHLTSARGKRRCVVISGLSVEMGLESRPSVEGGRGQVIKLSEWFRRGMFPALKWDTGRWIKP